MNHLPDCTIFATGMLEIRPDPYLDYPGYARGYCISAPTLAFADGPNWYFRKS